MAANRVPLSDLLVIQANDTIDGKAFWIRVKGADAERTELARRLAIEIAGKLAEPSDGAFDAWLTRLEGGPEHDEATKDEIGAYLLSDFTLSQGDPEKTRLQAAVVEHLWAAVAAELEGGWGRPLHVEHDHFSVLDHGADGVSLYEAADSDLRFRLWESKRHAASASVTTTITNAAKQLAAAGPQYLARISKLLQLHADGRIQVLGGRIVKLWTTKDDRSAVGVSVGRTAGGGLPQRPLRGLREQFGFSDLARHEGVIIEISDLPGFADEVRRTIIKGID